MARKVVVFAGLLCSYAAGVYVSYPKLNQVCQVDADCFEPWEHCGEKDMINVCLHKESLPFLPAEWVGLFILLVNMVCCNAAGMGGGGTVIPLSMLLFGFNPTDALTLSNLTIGVSGVVRYFYDLKKRHPLKKDFEGNPAGTLLEYNIAILLMPMQIVGAAIGAVISYMIPGPILLTVNSFCLVFIFYITVKKLCTMHKAETLQKKESISTAQTPLLFSSERTQRSYYKDFEQNEALKTYIEKEGRHLGPKMYFSMSMILVVFFVSWFRGNGKVPSIIGVTKCEPLDIALLVVLILAGLCFTYISTKWEHKDYIYKKSIGYKNIKGDIDATPKAIAQLAALGFTSGLLNAGFGVGPAFVLTPGLVLFDQHPACASATSQYIAMLSTLASTIVVYLLDKLNLQYAMWFSLIALIGTVPGIKLQHGLVELTGRPSVTVMLLLFFILFCLATFPLLSLKAIEAKEASGMPVWIIRDYCNV
jgi:uncharacterized membrane protein YfcA